MDTKNQKTQNSGQQGIDLLTYVKCGWPLLLFPALYFPYKLFWMRGFAMLAERVLHGSTANTLRLFFTFNNTILLFWCLVTAVVMAAALVVAIRHIRPWYAILLYLALVFSLCGILSLLFYSSILR